MLRLTVRLAVFPFIAMVIAAASARGFGAEFGRSVLIWEHQYLPSIPATILWDAGRMFRFRDSLRIRDFRWSATGQWAWISVGIGNRGIRVQVWQDGRTITVSEPNSFNMDLHWLDARLVWRSWLAGHSGRVYTWDGTTTKLDDTLTSEQVSRIAPRITADDGRTVSVERVTVDLMVIRVSDGDSIATIYGDYGLIRNIGWTR